MADTDLRVLSGRPIMYQIETTNGPKELPLYPFSLGKIVVFLEKLAFLVAEAETFYKAGQQESWLSLFRKKDWQGVLAGLLRSGRDSLAELMQIAFESKPIEPGRYTALTKEEAIWGMTLPGMTQLIEDIYRQNELENLLKKMIHPGEAEVSDGDQPSPP